MLNTFFVPGERITSAPGVAWWRDALWLAYLNLNGALTVRWVPVLGDPAGSQLHVTGFDASGECSLAEWGDQLWLVYADPSGFLHLASSSDGHTFSLPLALGIECGWKTGLAGTASGLWLLWADNAGGDVHLWRSQNGTAFVDVGLSGVNTRSSLALASDHENRQLALMWTERAGGPHSVSVARLEIDNPDPALPNRVSVETPTNASYVSGAFTGGHGGRRLLLVAEEDLPGPGGLAVQGRTIAADLSRVGGIEAFSSDLTFGSSLAASGSRVWAAWRSSNQDELKVAPYDFAFELPEELNALLETPCDPNVCPPDPRLVCEAQEEHAWVWELPSIANAKRGDLVLTPSDGVGMVGTLIGKVSPQQFYDHMGIMVADKTMIRHATMAHDRVSKTPEYFTGSILGEPAPTDGIRPDLLKFGWPGTITQSIDDAFYTGFNTYKEPGGWPTFATLNPNWDYYTLNPAGPVVREPPPGSPPEAYEPYFQRRRFCDPERPQGPGYAIHNFPNVPAFHLALGKLIYGRVVKPDPALEAQDAEIRATLHRIADESLEIFGHYRFFSYSQAKIALDPIYAPPDASDSSWAALPAGANWPAGTAPVVCSSFVWMAVQRASGNGLPKLELEGIVTESPEEQLGAPPRDGLYRYTEDERRAAARALHEYVTERTQKQVREQLMALAEESAEFEWALRLSKIGVAALILLLHGPGIIAAAVLGIGEDDLADIALLFNDMPDQLANQMCNTFAFDHAAHVDSDAWENPGEGLAVSPDDISNFWDSPAPPLNREIRHGLWGHWQQLLLTEARFVPKRVHKLNRSEGLAIAWGRVLFEEEALTGADVEIGCDEDMTRLGRHDFPSYYLEVPAGRHEIVAGAYWPASNWWLTGRQLATLEPGDNRVDIVLDPPPEWRRIIRISGKIDLVHRVLIGHDDWLHQPVSAEARLQFAPNTWGDPPPHVHKRTDTFRLLSDMAGPERVYIEVAVTLHDDLGVTAVLKIKHLEDYFGKTEGVTTTDISDHLVVEDEKTFTVAPDVDQKITIDTKSGDTPPDRAHIELSVFNDRAPA